MRKPRALQKRRLVAKSQAAARAAVATWAPWRRKTAPMCALHRAAKKASPINFTALHGKQHCPLWYLSKRQAVESPKRFVFKAAPPTN